MPQPSLTIREVREGRLFEQGIRVETDLGRLEIPWHALRCTHLGRIRPPRALPGDSPQLTSSGAALAVGVDKGNSVIVPEQSYLVLDLYAHGVVCRLNTINTNLKSHHGANEPLPSWSTVLQGNQPSAKPFNISSYNVLSPGDPLKIRQHSILVIEPSRE